MDKIALQTLTSNSRKLHCSLRKQECKNESEIYNYQRIQLSNDKFINRNLEESLTWFDCNSINIPAAKRLSVGWAAATQNLSCSLLKVWTPVLKRKHTKKLHNSTKWTQHSNKLFWSTFTCPLKTHRDNKSVSDGLENVSLTTFWRQPLLH